MDVCYHYTVRAHLPAILSDGYLKPATAGVPKHERPVVWFSTNPIWDETANKMYKTSGGLRWGTRETTHQYGGGLIRIVVAKATAPHDWVAFKRLSGIRSKEAAVLSMVGIKARADPREWFVSFEPVPAAMWLGIEAWTGTEWVPLDSSPPPPLGDNAGRIYGDSMVGAEELEQLLAFEELLTEFVRARPEHADCYKILTPADGKPQVLVKTEAYEPLGQWMLATGRGDPREILDLLAPDVVRTNAEQARPLQSWLDDCGSS